MYKRLSEILRAGFKENHGCERNLAQINADDEYFDLLLKAFEKMGLYCRSCEDFEEMKYDMKRFHEKYIYIDTQDLARLNPRCMMTSNIELSKTEFYTCKEMIKILVSVKKEFKNKYLQI